LTNVWSLLWKDYSMATMQQCWLMDRCNCFLSWNLDMFLVTYVLWLQCKILWYICCSGIVENSK
jgi:hypothetical protein